MPLWQVILFKTHPRKIFVKLHPEFSMSTRFEVSRNYKKNNIYLPLRSQLGHSSRAAKFELPLHTNRSPFATSGSALMPMISWDTHVYLKNTKKYIYILYIKCNSEIMLKIVSEKIKPWFWSVVTNQGISSKWSNVQYLKTFSMPISKTR